MYVHHSSSISAHKYADDSNFEKRHRSRAICLRHGRIVWMHKSESAKRLRNPSVQMIYDVAVSIDIDRVQKGFRNRVGMSNIVRDDEIKICVRVHRMFDSPCYVRNSGTIIAYVDIIILLCIVLKLDKQVIAYATSQCGRNRDEWH